MRKQDLTKLASILKELYPDPKSELNFTSEYQLVVSVILSAQCTDKKVNQVTPALFKNYSSFRALARAGLEELQGIIRPVNYYKTKAKNLIALAKLIIEQHRGKLPTTHKELQQLPGIGQKTASVVVSEIGSECAFPVDTHVFRVSHRLGLSAAKSRNATEDDLREVFPQELWRPMHHWLIFHGRRICKASRPLCSECALIKLCPTGQELQGLSR